MLHFGEKKNRSLSFQVPNFDQDLASVRSEGFAETMAPSAFDFGDWWGKETHKGTPVVVKMENPNWSMLELESPDEEHFHRGEKGRVKNAKQLTWVLLLKARKAAGCLTSIAGATWGLAAAIKKRVASGRTDSEISSQSPVKNRSRFYSCIKGFLFLAILLLGFELVAYSKGWHFNTPSLHFPYSLGLHSLPHSLYSTWVLVRVEYLAPPLQLLANVCMVLFLIQSLDRLVLCLGCFWIRFKKHKPVPTQELGGSGSDLEGGDAGNYPMVLVQIPLCNEKEVYEQSIAAVCSLDWPRAHMLIQVLDDSDDPTTQMLIKEEVQKWQQSGANIVYRHRVIRDGYKAGNLKSAMNCNYVKYYEFVAIFDADFQPSPDFLKRTVPHFKDNNDLALVQARWYFVNKEENLLSFHFEVEQQVNGVFINFFGFNGTAGVWRIKALEEPGGWLERTTVEAHLNGWKFIFLNDVELVPQHTRDSGLCVYTKTQAPEEKSQLKLLYVTGCHHRQGGLNLTLMDQPPKEKRVGVEGSTRIRMGDSWHAMPAGSEGVRTIWQR